VTFAAESRSETCLLALAGPTAVGKSGVAQRLAQQLNGEIISVDSMQVYRGLDIGTAKPSAQERQFIRHHLVDVVDITASFDAAQFVELAHQAVMEIRARGRIPILCGGTGLYFKAFFEGLGSAPSGSAALRTELGATPFSELLQELAECDPATYQRIDRQNPRRVIRALEVIRLTGKPYSLQRSDWSAPSSGCPIFGLLRDSADLQRRINARVDAMFAQGLIAETETLLKVGLAANPTALQALGYRQVVEHLRGLHSLPETIALVKTRTRQFAKRQMTWFRRQLPIRWIQVAPGDSIMKTATELARHFAQQTA
jgi:tRNA dimethylallyltransferase